LPGHDYYLIRCGLEFPISDIRVEEKKLFGITVYKKIAIFQNMMKDSGEMMNSKQREVSNKLRKFYEISHQDNEEPDS